MRPVTLGSCAQRKGMDKQCRHMTRRYLPNDVGVEREIVMRDQIAQSCRRGAMFGRERSAFTFRQSLDGLADDLQVEQHRVERGLVTDECLNRARATVRRPIFSAAAIRSSR